MDCEKVQELLSGYVDNMLDDNLKEDVENHINSCEACRHELELLTSIIECCHEFEDQDLPDNFHNKLHHRLLNEKRNGRRDKILTGFRKYGAAAAAFLVIAVSVGVFINSGIIDMGPKKSTGSAENRQAENFIAAAEAPEMISVPEQNSGNQNMGASMQDQQSMKAADTGAAVNITSSESQAVRVLTTAVINITEDQYNLNYNSIKASIEGLQGYSEKDNPIAFMLPKENMEELIKKLDDDYDITNVSVNTTDISAEYESLKAELSSLESEQNNIPEGGDRGSINKQIENKKSQLIDLDRKVQLVYIQINRI